MNFNQLQKIAKKAGWTTGYTPPKHVAKLLNETIDNMTDIQRSQLHKEIQARGLQDPVNFIAGFADLIAGKLVQCRSDGFSHVMEQVAAYEAAGTSGVIDMTKLTAIEKMQFLQVLAQQK